MASDWVGVIGTGIGAGIGGMVTVASLIVKGKQEATARREAAAREDRLRAEDRAWQLRLDDRKDRQKFFQELLAAADTACLGVIGLAKKARELPQDVRLVDDPASESQHQALLQGVFEFLQKSAPTHTMAFDRQVLDVVNDFRQALHNAVMVMNFRPERAEIDQAESRTRDLVEALREACRRDLGGI